MILEEDFCDLDRTYADIQKERNPHIRQEALQTLKQETNLYYVALSRAKVFCEDLSENEVNYQEMLKNEETSHENGENDRNNHAIPAQK